MDLNKILELLEKDFSFSRKDGHFTLKVDEFEYSSSKIEELLTVFGDFVLKGVVPKKPKKEKTSSSPYKDLTEEIRRLMREVEVNRKRPREPYIIPLTPFPKTPFDFPRYPWHEIWCSIKNNLDE